jgi:DNA-directed RNA polymerase specialized sigma subunit
MPPQDVVALLHDVVDQEVSLERAMQAKERLAVEFHGWVGYQAASIGRRWGINSESSEWDDVQAEAFVGFDRGVRAFRFERVTNARGPESYVHAFLHTARVWIRREVQAYLARARHGVSRSVAERRCRIMAIEAKLRSEGRPTTAEAIAETMRETGLISKRRGLKWDAEQVARLRDAGTAVALETCGGDHVTATNDASIPEQSETPAEAIEREDLRRIVRARVRGIASPERQLVVALSCGMSLRSDEAFGQPHFTVTEIAEVLGLTPAEVEAHLQAVATDWKADATWRDTA